MSASAPGIPADEGTPRDGDRGGRADDGVGSLPAGRGNAGPDGYRADDLSQEEILDLIVEAMIARGGPSPEEDDPADEDKWDADDPWDTPDARGPQDTEEQGSAPGWGFGSDKTLDVLRPGPALAGMADKVHTSALRLVSDDELTGMIKAWRRLTSWATARELSAIAEMARRSPEDVIDTPLARRIKARRAASDPEAVKRVDATRTSPADGAAADPAGQAAPDAEANSAAQHAPAAGTGSAAHAGACADRQSGAESDFPEVISPFASYELALALTLTGRSADAHLGFAIDLATKLPKTAAALEAGEIDIVRARIIAEATNVLSKEHTAAVEDLIFPRAGQQTSGQLRAALARAVLSADSDAARRRREEAQRDARVLRWREDAGTAALCGRDLPSAEVLAADQRISARARELKSAGIKGTMDELRARAYLDFLLGRDSMPREPNDEPQQATPANDPPADEHPASGPPASEPRVGEPSVGSPPADEHPASGPPADEHPASGPPASEPRVGEPPVGSPPTNEHPASGPPASEHPPSGPPASEHPASGPPADEPRVGEPPVGSPPTNERLASGPPGSEPPPDGLAADGPAADGFSGITGWTASGMPPGSADGLRVTPWTTGGPPGSLAALINVTVPLSTMLGFSDAPGEVAAFGPLDADVTRDLVGAAGLHPATRWCVTVVDPDGQAVGHGCARGKHSPPTFSPAGDSDPPGDPPDGNDRPSRSGNRPGDGGLRNGGGERRPEGGPGKSAPDPLSTLHGLNLRTFVQQLGVKITPLAVGTCDHRNEEQGYQLSRRLRHLIAARTMYCSAPGCRRPATRCDFDHTIAYEAGGRSCECNVRPLCRRHHRCKQAPRWALEQPNPGTMIWTTPARRYKTEATRYYV